MTQDAQVQTRFATYLQLLEQWNRTYNLVSSTNLQQVCATNFDYSTFLINFIEKNDMGSTDGSGSGKGVVAPATSLVDVGAGAGIPSAFVAMQRPDWMVFAVDRRRQSITFLQRVKQTLNLTNLLPLHMEASQFLQQVPQAKGPHIACSRFLAPLHRSLQLVEQMGIQNYCRLGPAESTPVPLPWRLQSTDQADLRPPGSVGIISWYQRQADVL